MTDAMTDSAADTMDDLAASSAADRAADHASDHPWPPALRWTEAAFQLVAQTRSGGQSFQGAEQVVRSPTARWKASLTLLVIDRRDGPVDQQDAVLAWRWVLRGGRAATLRVPVRDGRGPAHRLGLVPCRGDVPFSDGVLLSDGAGFAQAFTGARLAEAGAANAAQVRIALAAGLPLVPGMRFSLPDGRLHEVGAIAASDGAGLWTVAIAPWLRADYPAGTAVEFDSPVCRMRLAADEAALSLRFNRFATPTVEFVEAF